DEVSRKADARGIRVTGSELVGLIPLKSVLDAGRYFLTKQQRSSGVSDEVLIKIAVKSMGLSDIHEFKPEEKIIEYVMENNNKRRLISMSLKEFMNETASESPAPGGGSVSAYMGSLGVALGTMVANISSHKRGWDDHWKEFSDWAEKGKAIQNQLIQLVDEDTEAFNLILNAFSLPKKTEEEVTIRKSAVQEATREAMLVPFKVMETAFSGFSLVKEMVEKGNPNSVTDAAVGAMAIRTCIRGAFMNVRINSSGLEDKAFVMDLIKKGQTIESESLREEEAILKKAEEIIKH
ncbi:MAG TPA: glutamate formimidoyltransferase, partial [Bacteroidales bacterium]|nr:glutamate formimidoyltransferase [Bacteroidales bacterium]HBZ20819.1 glutamate formimidoyltransferase [Bacteroidales bacterium]